MPIDLIIRPNIAAHDLNVLSRLRQEFDRKLESQEPLTPKEIVALGTNLWEALAHAVDGANGAASAGMEKILARREQAIAGATAARRKYFLLLARPRCRLWYDSGKTIMTAKIF